MGEFDLNELEKYVSRESLLTGFVKVDIYDAPNASYNIDPEAILLQSRLKPPGNIEYLETVPAIRLFITNSQDPRLIIINEHNFLLEGPLDSRYFVNNIHHIAYNIGERVRQEELGIISMRGAAVISPDGKGHMILGDKGAGKTGTLLALCKDYGYRILGDDLILIRQDNSQIVLCGGSLLCFVRPNVYDKLFNVDSRLRKGLGDFQNIYERKIAVYPPDMGLIISTDPIPLATVTRINVHIGNKEVEIAPPQPTWKSREFLRLQEDLARYIRGQVTVLYIGQDSIKGSFPPLDSEKCGTVRNNTLETLLNNYPFRYIYGNNPTITANFLSRSLLTS